MIKEILDEINLENGSNYKKDVLKKHQDNELLLRVFKMALDKVTYTYGITMKNVVYSQGSHLNSLEYVLDELESRFCTREITGNAAIERLGALLQQLSADDAYVVERILDRDLKIRLGRSEVNKVFKDLIVKPPYTRCEIGTEANITKNMPMDKDGNFINKVFSEVKMDGTFIRSIIDGESITMSSRPGIEKPFPTVEKDILTLNADGHALIGEMNILLNQVTFDYAIARIMKDLKKDKSNMSEIQGSVDELTELFEEGATYLPRSISNSNIDSDETLHDYIVYTVWDMVPLSEFRMNKDEIKAAEKAGTLSKYEDRLALLEANYTDSKHLKLIEYKIVKNMQEAFEHFQEITERGEEGTVIKAHDMTHKDGNSKKQLKVKLVIELDVRITGFTEGNKGKKNEDYFSAITFQNDEGTIVGQVGVTSLTESTRDWFHENRELVIGDVMTLHCNDITKSRGNDFHALSHGRYQELRGKDKETDTFERAQEQKQMAMEMKERVR